MISAAWQRPHEMRFWCDLSRWTSHTYDEWLFEEKVSAVQRNADAAGRLQPTVFRTYDVWLFEAL